MYFKYGNKELNYLSNKDLKMKTLIETYGYLEIKVNDNLFNEIVDSLLSQQISIKAAITIKERLINLIGDINPLNINNQSLETINSLGIPLRRAEALKSLAAFFLINPNIKEDIKDLSNEDKVKELIKFKGIGPWTAKMLLIHSFNELDIFPTEDLGIKRGLMNVYGLSEVTKENERYFKELFSPYGSVAAFYIWKASE